ncbi:MAG: D-alanyl-D-alanine carboxypeptidase/D-alanyl-D-alanine-endopeptidase [Rhodobacteraceae bacterium]|nr:MAG: D-alanyl-D-alanine carboxypeptidase/D-alanyl-D-alanine-endopeptidase [Paracoccaceae bacterium]
MQETELGRRRVLNLILWGSTLCAMPACANAPERSRRPELRRAPPATGIVSRAGLGGDIAYAVIDVQSGNLLEGQGANTPLPPASVAKAITALYALETLGPAFQFRTRLIATGPISDGVLRGDLVLAGGGDPTLETDHLAAMAADLARAGVRQITGRFLVWGGALPFVSEIASDQSPQAGYNPSVSGLNLNFNRVHFEWRRAGADFAVSMDARSNSHRPAVSMARMQIVNRASPLYTYQRSATRDEWTVARSALGNTGSRWLPVRHPELYAGEVFRSLAAGRAVTLPAPELIRALPAGTELVTHRAQPLQDILRDLLRFSTNISAEAVGMTATAARSGAPASLAASGAAMSDWARTRYGMSSARLLDHSGLGAGSRVSMGDLANMFRRAGQDGALRPLLRQHQFRDARNNPVASPGVDVQAKTGTLFFVSALGGYVVAPGGRELAFAIASADLTRRAQVAGGNADRPQGTVEWSRRARQMQQDLLTRWAQAHSR